MSDAQTMGLTLQSASESDLDEILAIERLSFSAPWSRKMFEIELTDNQFGSLLIVRRIRSDSSHSELVGYICFWVVFEELRFMNLAVAPHTRRQGIGRELVQSTLQSGLEQGATRALLEVRASNVDALVFYERIGFRQYAVRAAYYTNPSEDAILMILDPIAVS